MECESSNSLQCAIGNVTNAVSLIRDEEAESVLLHYLSYSPSALGGPSREALGSEPGSFPYDLLLHVPEPPISSLQSGGNDGSVVEGLLRTK